MVRYETTTITATLSDGETERWVIDTGSDDAVRVTLSADAQPYDLDIQTAPAHPAGAGQFSAGDYTSCLPLGAETYTDTSEHTTATDVVDESVYVEITNNSGGQTTFTGTISTHSQDARDSAQAFTTEGTSERASAYRDGKALGNSESFNADDVIIAKGDDGRLYVDPTADFFSGDDIGARIQDSLDWLQANNTGGIVVVPTPSGDLPGGDAHYLLQTKFTIPQPTERDHAYSVVAPSKTTFVVDAGFGATEAIELDAGSGGKNYYGELAGIRVDDSVNDEIGGQLILVSDAARYTFRDLDLNLGTSGIGIRLDPTNWGIDHSIFKNIQVIGDGGKGIDNQNGNAAGGVFDCRFEKIHVNRLGSGSVGFSTGTGFTGNKIDQYYTTGLPTGLEMRGKGNDVWIRAEDPTKPSLSDGAVRTPVEELGPAYDNTYNLHPGSNAVWRWSSFEGERPTFVGDTFFREYHTDTGVGAVVPETWNQDLSSGASASVQNAHVRLSTGATNGNHAMLDYNGQDAYSAALAPHLRATSFRLLDDTSMRVELGFYRNANNLFRVYYDTAAPNGVSGSNFVAESIVGGTATRTDTGVAGSGYDNRVKINIKYDDSGSAQEVQYILGDLERAYHTVGSEVAVMEPRFRVETKEGVSKEVQYYTLEIGGLDRNQTDLSV